jgi:outer membrane protein
LRDSLSERVSELRRRANIGQTRRSDLLSAQAQAQATESELLALESQIQASRRALAITAAISPDAPLSDDVNFPKEIPSLESYVEKIRSHPNLEVARREVQIAEQSRRVASSGHWPQLDLQGNYYIERPGVLADSKWDVSLNLTLPLFQGGIVSSQVRDQVYARTQKELDLALLEKQMDASLRNYHEEAVKAQAILEGARKSVDLYRQSYTLLNQEYRNGIISYLEVNPVEREYWESLRRLQHQEAEFKLAWVRLQAIVGENP